MLAQEQVLGKEILLGKEIRLREGLMFANVGSLSLKNGDWGAAQVVDGDIGQSILIEIALNTSHGGNSVGVVRERCGIKRERLEASGSARGWRHYDAVRPRIDVYDVIRESVAVKIIQDDSHAEGGDPDGDLLESRVDSQRLRGE